MRIGVVPENLLERIALSAGLAPVALAESWFPFLLARAIMVGVRLGVFEALAGGPLSTEQVAKKIGGDARATGKLLVALTGCGYLLPDGDRYTLAPRARMLLADEPGSARDKVLLQFLEWDWWMQCENFVKTGEPLRLHERLDDDEWGIYQRGMRSGNEMIVREVVKRLKLPSQPAKMLDIGGSHGYWSVSFCRRHPSLRATVLDLPQAIVHAAPVLAKENMGDRVVHRPGDALKDELGKNEWDFVFIASLVHHFDEPTNRALMKRVGEALKPGGVVGVFDAFRVGADGVGQIGGLMDLFFALTSQSGTWTPDEIASWQRDAGLQPRAAMRLRMVRDIGVQAAVKPLA